jgi:Ankyrin repeat
MLCVMHALDVIRYCCINAIAINACLQVGYGPFLTAPCAIHVYVTYWHLKYGAAMHVSELLLCMRGCDRDVLVCAAVMYCMQWTRALMHLGIHAVMYCMHWIHAPRDTCCNGSLTDVCLQDGRTALHVASREGHAAVVAQLLGAKEITVNAAKTVIAQLVPQLLCLMTSAVLNALMVIMVCT